MIEVLAPGDIRDRASAAAPDMCGALASAWGISEQIVTVYIPSVPVDGYVQAGQPDGTPRRLFIKLHAFRRSKAARRSAAKAITDALVSTGVPAADIIVYFLDRSADEVAHGGVLQA